MYNICINIVKDLEVNLLVLKIAALLHDIGRIDENKDNIEGNHAEISAEKAQEFLVLNKFKFTQKEIANIIHCIKAHSFSNKVIPKSIEAKILSDADKLDALGAIGLYRTIGFTVRNQGGIEQVIEHLENKIMRLKDLLFLDTSKRIAEERYKIIYNFLNMIKKEK